MVTSEDLKIKDQPLAHLKIFDISDCSHESSIDQVGPKYQVYTNQRPRDVAMRASYAMGMSNGQIKIIRKAKKTKVFNYRIQESSVGKKQVFRLT